MCGIPEITFFVIRLLFGHTFQTCTGITYFAMSEVLTVVLLGDSVQLGCNARWRVISDVPFGITPTRPHFLTFSLPPTAELLPHTIASSLSAGITKDKSLNASHWKCHVPRH